MSEFVLKSRSSCVSIVFRQTARGTVAEVCGWRIEISKCTAERLTKWLVGRL